MVLTEKWDGLVCNIIFVIPGIYRSDLIEIERVDQTGYKFEPLLMTYIGIRDEYEWNKRFLVIISRCPSSPWSLAPPKYDVVIMTSHTSPSRFFEKILVVAWVQG